MRERLHAGSLPGTLIGSFARSGRQMRAAKRLEVSWLSPYMPSFK
jgi:hypothetical protein